MKGQKKKTVASGSRKRHALFVGWSAAAMAMAPSASSAAELLVNGNFESGDFLGWTSTESDGPTDGCDTRWTVGASLATTGCSGNGRNPANPLGTFAAYSSFDGNGPQTFSLRQGVNITGSMSNATLSWSDSFGALYTGAPRTMAVNIVGATTQTVFIYTLPFDLPSATGWTNHSLDITAALNNFVGQSISIEFLLTIPEDFTGPAGAGLDNVSLDVTLGAFDGTPPGLTINGPGGTQTAPFPVTFAFSEDVAGFDASDVVLTNASLSGFSGSGSSYSATVTPLADGLVSLDVAAGAFEDTFGNDSAAPASFSVQADITLPTATVAGPAGPVNAPFVATFNFSEDVNNFILGDIAVVNGVASGFGGAGASYSATITPTIDGAVQVSLAAGVANDAATNGNQASNTFSIVADLTAPIITTPGIITVGTDAGLDTAVVTYNVTASDPGNGALTPTLVSGPVSGSAFPIGTTPISYSATDTAGNVANASFDIIVGDDEDPVIVGLPADINVNTDSGQPTAIVNWSAPTVTDNAAGATITQTAGLAPGAAFPIGTTTITYEAEDASGNIVTGSFNVTVTDNEGPAIISLPADINVDTDAGLATAVVSWSAPTVADNAPGATIAQTAGPAPGSALPIGTTTITYEAEDAAGNTTTASFTVTVTDNEGPVIVSLPADISTSTDPGQSTAVVNWSAPTVTDNAPGATITQTSGPAPSSALPIGVTTITYEAEDASGNTVTASFTITINDNEGPSIVSLPADISVNTDPGQPTAVVNWTPPGVTDNAPGATITQTSGPAPGSAFPVGTTTISYEAEDAAGNIATASFNITVQDAEPPAIVSLPADIAQPTDSGLSTAVVTWTPPTVTDNAPGATITQTAGLAPGSAFPIGVTTITYQAQDAAGNIVTASFNVTIEDDEPPAIVGLPADISVDTDTGQPTAVVSWTPPTVSDNAPGATITQTAGPAPGAAFPIGTATITYEAEDVAGNTTTASFTVTVEDNELPVIAGLPANIAVNTDVGLPTAVVSWSVPTVSDNAPGATITQTAGPAPGSEFPVGVTTITYQALDIAGNTVTQSFTVTVTDAEPPAFVGFPANITIVVDYPHTSAVANWAPPTITDNSPGATITQIAGPAPGATFPLGATTITYRAQDGSGNIVDRSFTVTVSQTPPGSVRLVVQSGKDGSFAFSSPAPDLNFTISTVGGDGDETVTIHPGVFNLAFALPAGFGILSADCNDSNSSLNADSQSGQVNVSSNELVTCTIVTVDSLTETSRLIGAFMGARANLITQNMPDSDRRIDRLNGRAPEPGGVSAFGMSIGRGETPFDLSIGEDRANFSFSLAGLRAQQAQNRRDARDNAARWGDGEIDPRWAQSRGHDFSSFGNAGPSDDPYALAAGLGAGETRAPNGRREGGHADASNSETARLPDTGPQAVDFWVEGAFAQFDTNVGDGDFYMLSAGVDYVNDHDVLIGFGAAMDWTDMSGPVAGSSMSGAGYLVGPYMTARLSDGLYFDGQISIGRSKNEVSPFGVYEDEVDAERTYLSGALIGDIRRGPWTLRPEGRVTYFREEMDSYVDGIGVTIPSIEVKTGEFEFSPTVRYRYELEGDSVFTPFASVEGIWTFDQSNTAAFALGSDAFIDNGVRGRLEAGFDFVRPSGMRMSGVGFYDGIGEEDFASWGAQVRMSWSFEPD